MSHSLKNSLTFQAVSTFIVGGIQATTSEVYTRRASVRVRDDAFNAAHDLWTETQNAYPSAILVTVRVTLNDRAGTAFTFYPSAFGIEESVIIPLTDDASFDKALDAYQDSEFAAANEFPALLDSGETVTDDILTDFGDDELSEAMMLHGDEATNG
jgi:hypothetical protein